MVLAGGSANGTPVGIRTARRRAVRIVESVTGDCACGRSGAAWVGGAGVRMTGVRGSRCGRISGHGGLHDRVPPRAQGAGFGPVHHGGIVGIGCGGGYPARGGARARVAGGLGRVCGSHGDYRSRAVLGRSCDAVASRTATGRWSILAVAGLTTAAGVRLTRRAHDSGIDTADWVGFVGAAGRCPAREWAGRWWCGCRALHEWLRGRAGCR